MKYALIHGERQEAQPGLSGKCICCGDLTVSKCGKVKIWHWAHKGKRMCDPWWENETEWHRSWKGLFAKEYQEIIHYAENGDKHIADVKTKYGYVIEFQHSFIKSEERQAREDFYTKMIWIVDGTRRLRDKDTFIEVWKYSTFIDGRAELRRLHERISQCALVRDWSNRNVPVFFDFGEQVLLGLLPKTKENKVHLCSIDRCVLAASMSLESPKDSFEYILKGWNDLIANEERYLLWQARGSPPLRRYL